MAHRRARARDRLRRQPHLRDVPLQAVGRPDLGAGAPLHGPAVPDPSESSTKTSRAGSTETPPGPAPAGTSEMAENGTVRASRAPTVRARFTSIRKIHVFTEQRPSNRWKPSNSASQVSCTTSSATAAVDVDPGHSEKLRRVLLHQPHEGGFVALTQGRDQLTVAGIQNLQHARAHEGRPPSSGGELRPRSGGMPRCAGVTPVGPQTRRPAARRQSRGLGHARDSW